MLVTLDDLAILGGRFPWRSNRFLVGVGLRPLEDISLALHRDHNEEAYLAHKKELSSREKNRVFPPLHQLTDDELKASVNLLGTLRPDLATLDFHNFCLNVQEDISLWKAQGEQEWLAALHLSCPNHWAPEEKIGKSFIDVHAPIPGIAPISAIARKLFQQNYERGPTERLAWGVATDTLLDHHPQYAAPGRSFNPEKPELYVRLERQSLLPVPECSVMIFTIRTYFLDCAQLPREDRVSIANCIQSMSPALLHYKGLANSSTPSLIDFLTSSEK
jgi:hypothetical protein